MTGPARSTPIWWHPAWRVRIAVIVSVLVAAAAVALAATGNEAEAATMLGLLVVTAVMQLRPWIYAHVRAPQIVLRGATIVLFLVPVLAIAATPVREPSHLVSLAVGVVTGLAFVGVHARDSILLLTPELVAWQPRMSVAGAVSRFLYVVAVVPLEELFYRKLIIDSFAGLVGGVLAALISVAAFLYGDWSGSWGPASSRKRFWSELGLAVVTAGTYLATGSLVGPLITHYLYNGPQLALPPVNVYVHRRTPHDAHQEPTESVEV
ncbi:CPBP family intramembrane glutamic endopeptidase [Streptomyces sp. MI02-7b]|uniref:CPBP family intramembrane glutamic endopeptidase n=1 Tax=Streptomyces sp. MI02-7b TaxID=462941 RepID=UPI0029B62BD4|nr:CPBP family intramembrane glutamic endopeptidase [Streptomyces sp. MI02-7b]MDX3078377.1 CPBP family intramembrane metalloprotease [Streptomyces sp. MI02-7b]